MQQALTLIPADHPERASLLSSVTEAWLHRFETLDTITDLAVAIEAGNTAVSLWAIDDPRRAMSLSCLARALTSRIHRDAESNQKLIGHWLNEACTLSEEAVNIAAEDDPNLITYPLIDSNVLLKRGPIEDIASAILRSEQALKLDPKDSVMRVSSLTCLGNAVFDRFKKTNSDEDLNKSIEIYEEAFRSMPTNHANTWICYSNFGLCLKSRFNHTKSMEDMRRSRDLFKTITTLSTAPIKVRIDAAAEAAELFYSDDIGKLNQLRKLVIALLSTIN